MVAVSEKSKLPSKFLRRITAYLHPELYSDLEKTATDDKRTISQMAAILIEEALKARKRKPKKEEVEQ